MHTFCRLFKLAQSQSNKAASLYLLLKAVESWVGFYDKRAGNKANLNLCPLSKSLY